MLLRFLVLSLFITSTAHAQVYKWVDASGNVHYSDTPPASQKARSIKLKPSVNTYNSPPTTRTNSNKVVATKGDNSLPQLAPRQVIIYSTVWCGFCKKAKAYFKQKGIAYSERDIEKSSTAKKEYQSYGAGGVPLILVGNTKGTRKLSGFSIARFDAAYK